MKKQLLNSILFVISLLFSAFKINAQCIDTLPANTIVILNDTTIGNGSTRSYYLICPGKKLIYSGTQSIMNDYYLEQGSKLTLNSYHYPNIYLKNKSELNAQHSLSNPSRIMSIHAENGCIFKDTIDYFTSSIKWCSPLQYSYVKLPKSKGCPVASNPIVPVKEEISIYPNPLSTFTTLNNLNYSTVCIKIYNMQGQTVYQSNFSNPERNIKIDLSNQCKGIYIIHIFGSSKSSVNGEVESWFKKIVIQ